MANVTANVSTVDVTVTSTPANITVTDVESNIALSAISTSVVNVSVDSNQLQVNVAPLLSVSNTQIRAAISAVDAGGDGSFTYDEPSGVFTYTGPNQTEANARIANASQQVRAHIGNTDPVLYDSSTGIISLNNTTLLSGQTTDNLTEGSTNLYLNGAGTTDDLTEGSTNQYFTNARVLAGIVDGNVKLKEFSETVAADSGNIFGNVTFDVSAGTIHSGTLTGNIHSISFSNFTAGSSMSIVLTQNAVGGFIIDTGGLFSSYWNDWEFANDETIPQPDPNTTSLLTVTYDGTKHRASLVRFDTPLNTVTVNGTTIALGDSGNISHFGDLTTDSLTEGSTNLYLTPSSLETILGDSDGLVNVSAYFGKDLLVGENITNMAIGYSNAGVIRARGTGYHTNSSDLVYAIQPENALRFISGIAWHETEGRLYQHISPANSVSEKHIIPIDTDELAEGSTNFYFTNASANAAIVTYLGDAANGPFVINGNLQVQGNIDYVNVEDLLVNDQSITLNYGNAAAQDAFIYVDRSGSALNNVALKWNETADRWQFTNDGTTYYNLATSTSDIAEGTNLYFTTDRANSAIGAYQGNINTAGDITANVFYGDLTGNIIGNGNLTGDLTVGGNLTVNGAEGVSTSRILPLANQGNVIIGQDALNTIKINDLTLYNEGTFKVQQNRSGGIVNSILSEESGNITLSIDGPGADPLFKVISSVGTCLTLNENGNLIVTGTIVGDSFTGDVIGNVTGTVSSLSNHDTDDLAESATRKYYSNTLVSDFVTSGSVVSGSGLHSLNINSPDTVGTSFQVDGLGNVTIGLERSAGVDGRFVLNGPGPYNEAIIMTATGNINADSTITASAFVGDLTGDVTGTVSSLSNHDTGDLAEGANLYFTTGRANSAIDAYVTGGNAITVASGVVSLDNTAVTPKTYGDATNVPQFTVDQQGRITAVSNVAISGGGAAANSFGIISVAGQSNVEADVSTDQVTFVAGSGVTITTDAATDSITFNSTGGYGNVDVQNFLENGYSAANINANDIVAVSFSGEGSDLTDVRAETIEATVKNVSGVAIDKGYPLHVTGATGGGTPEVILADAGNVATMPAHFIAGEDLAIDAEGRGILSGEIRGIDTATPGFVEGDTIYVAVGGGYGNTAPSGEANIIQNLGIVTRVDATNGAGEVYGAGRGAATPNLNDGNIFVGNGSNQAVSADLSNFTYAISSSADISTTANVDATIVNTRRQYHSLGGGDFNYVDLDNSDEVGFANIMVLSGKFSVKHIFDSQGSGADNFTVASGSSNIALANTWLEVAGAVQQGRLTHYGNEALFEGTLKANGEGTGFFVTNESQFDGAITAVDATFNGDVIVEENDLDVRSESNVNYIHSSVTKYADPESDITYVTPFVEVNRLGGNISSPTTLGTGNIAGVYTGSVYIPRTFDLHHPLYGNLLYPNPVNSYVSSIMLDNTSPTVSYKGPTFTSQFGGLPANYEVNVPQGRILFKTMNSDVANATIADGFRDGTSFQNGLQKANATVAYIDNKFNIGREDNGTSFSFPKTAGSTDQFLALDANNDLQWTSTLNNVTLGQFQETKVDLGSVSGDQSSALDAASGSIYTLTATGGITIDSLANAVAGTSMTIIITQDGTGLHALTSSMKFAGADKTLSTAPASIDIISVFYDGTNYYASLTKGYA